MPALTDYYKPPVTDPQQVQAFSLGEIGTERAGAVAKAGLGKSRLLSNWTQRTLPQLVSREGSRGTFFSGGAQTRANWAREDMERQGQDIELDLQDVLNSLRRRTFYTNLGL